MRQLKLNIIRMKNLIKISFLILSSFLLIQCGHQEYFKRQLICLNGTWDVEESLTDDIPKTFSHQTSVPGLIDTARPAFDSAGLKCTKRNYYWVRSFFTINNDIPPVALLKINKSMYGTKVFINGKEVGYNTFCFTPSYFNIHDFIKQGGEKNEIIVRLGAYLDNIADSIPNGIDFEKTKYFAGIYDDVNIILSDYPFIENVQIVPDINKKQIRIVAEINSNKDIPGFNMNYLVEENRTGEKCVSGKSDAVNILMGITKIDFTIPLNKCHLWSPEDPYLYKLNLSTGKDSKSQRFGMRTFRFDTTSGKAILNGKPYAMLGTNICIFRFFEDYSRGLLPWREDWVRRLHLQFKNMNWNCIRYCIGFPPEKWYDIADETGMLIQDEYPLWRASKPVGTNERILAEEYKRWMRERWNHPCVVIWDGTNETLSEVTGKAIDKVRDLDLSGRPFDNGYSLPRKADDCIESHPYLFIKYCDLWGPRNKPVEEGYMKDFFDTVRIPNNYGGGTTPESVYKKLKNPVIINEYDWLWLNRDGSTTTLTDSVYFYLFGKNLTTEQRRIAHAENVAVLTEYWRCHRKSAALMHFCELGYSRTGKPRGQTCDDFTDINNLVFEPNFFRLVKPKFALICNMIDAWEKHYMAEQKLTVPVYIINDQLETWNGTAFLYILQDDKKIIEFKKDIAVNSFGTEIIKYDI